MITVLHDSHYQGDLLVYELHIDLLFFYTFCNPARAQRARAQRARALRALGLLLADGALTVGWGKTFWGIGRVPSRKRA